jgi:tight adherence protein B
VRLPAVTVVGAATLVLVAGAAPTVVAAAVLVATTVEGRRRRSARHRRRKSEASALQGALDILVGELRVGAHPVAAFEAAAREIDGVVAAALRGIAARARMGADVATGLRDAARRSSLPRHWVNLAVCWQLAQSHGLAIATLMHTAQRDIVERERFAARVSAGMAGARATAGVLAGLPVVGIGLGQLIGADPVRFLMQGDAGGWLLIVGVAFACCGLVWSDRITDGVLR